MTTLAPTTDAFAETLASIVIVDADSHVTEPPDLWTSRLPARLADDAPHLVTDEVSGRRKWKVGQHLVATDTQFTHAGWSGFYPSLPPSMESADHGGWEPTTRLQRMDEYGIGQQLLYPNLLGFHYYAFLELDEDLRIACLRAYNDFQVEFASADPARLVPLMNLPFWDVPLSIEEMHRCRDLGHRGINFAWQMERVGLPRLRDDHWAPLLAAAQDLELPISFHIGFGSMTADMMQGMQTMTSTTDLVREIALLFLGNANCIGELIMSGLCHRFPRLSFVSVESGFGYLPFFLQALDWQFLNTLARSERPDWLLPSEYFARQIYATFWFERDVSRQLHLYQDNLMFSSDFPHPTSLSPGEGTTAVDPTETARRNLADLDPAALRKVLHDNAARLYGL
jgi:predicted TIM-barrel fold metal-dependent hydrolase